MTSPRNDRAFTLIELVVVVAIVGILTLIAAPNLARFRDIYRLKTVSNDYATIINLTRIQAISENRALRIVHHPDSDYDDGTRDTVCIWDVQAETSPGSGTWETIPLDGVIGHPSPNYAQTGLYNYSDEASPDNVPYISMQTTGQVEDGMWLEFNTKGYLDGYSGSSDYSNSECIKLVGFRNKANEALSRMQVCIGSGGIAQMRN